MIQDRSPHAGIVGPSVSSGADQGRIDQVLGQEPGLEFAGADHLGHQEVVGAVVTQFGGAGRRVMGLRQNRLVGVQQPRQG
jgi:hypothetical protein